MIAWIIVTIDGGTFLTVGNIVNMLQRSVALGIVSAGQTVVILAGSLDLSVAYVISLSSLVAAEVMDGQDANIVPAILAVLALGVVVGLGNGLVITKLRVNAFIATLGTGLIIKGYMDNRYDGPAGSIGDVVREARLHALRDHPAVGVPARGGRGGRLLPAALHALRLPPVRGRRRRGGLAPLRRAHAPHDHRRPRRLLDLRGAHRACSSPAGSGSGTPTVGQDGGYDLESIAAVVLGGTALAGGRGGVLGTIGGVFILAVLDNTFNQLEVNAFLKDVVRGVIIIAAVAVYARRSGTGAGYEHRRR